MKLKIPVAELKTMPKPAHIAIIMDGNGRWATSRGYPRTYGHLKGVGVVEKMTEFCAEIGVSALTLYSFSTENWKRPETEVGYLMSIFYKYMKTKLSKFMKNNIRFSVMGRRDDLAPNVREMIEITERETSRNTGMMLNLAVSYSGRAEILDAVKHIVADAKNGSLPQLSKSGTIDPKSLDFINGDFFKSYLYAPDLPEPELLIRTSNEFRISNFLLWQIAYSEIYITPKFWPEFTANDLIDAITDFNSRERRFGGLHAAPKK